MKIDYITYTHRDESAQPKELKYPPIKASELIEYLRILITKHGDLPVMFAIPDDVTVNVVKPKFDTDDAGDDCFII